MVLEGAAHYQPSPVEREDPADEDVGEHQLEEAHCEQGLAPLLGEARGDHGAEAYTR